MEMYTRNISRYWGQEWLDGHCTGPAPSDFQGRVDGKWWPRSPFWPARPRPASPSHLLLHTLIMHACQRALKLTRTQLHDCVTQYCAFQVVFWMTNMLLCNIHVAGT